MHTFREAGRNSTVFKQFTLCMQTMRIFMIWENQTKPKPGQIEEEKRKKEKRSELNRTRLCLVRRCERASSSSFLANGAQFIKIQGKEEQKKGDSIFVPSIGERVPNTPIYSMLLHLLFFLVHIIIAVNHSFSSPCQQTFVSFSWLCVCVFLSKKKRKQKRCIKPKKDKHRIG